MDRQKHTTKLYYRKWCAVIGALIILSPVGFSAMWGNFSVYVLSYFYSHDKLTSDLLTPWVVSTYFICLNASILVSGRLAFGKRNQLIFFGILLSNIGMSTFYFALEYVTTRLVFIAVTLIGLGNGILNSHVLKSVAECSVSQTKSLISIVSSSIAFGPCIINSLATLYVNPNNIPPDSIVAEIKIFSQQKVVEKVSSMFLILGAVNFFCQTIGFVMLLQKPKGKDSLQETNDSYGSVSVQQEVTSEGRNDASRNNNTVNDVVAMNVQDDAARRQSLTNGARVKEQGDSAPLQTLRHYAFYVLWVSYTFEMFAHILLSNFYKTFGMTKIPDDHFLASLGSAIAVASGVARILWGFALDRYGIKRCVIFLYSSIGNLLLFVYFTPLLNKWLYFITTVVLGSLLSCAYPFFVTATSAIFGLKHFNDNLGMLATAPILTSFIAPPIFNSLLVNVGWFAIFDWSALLLVMALILIVMKFPRVC